MKLAFSLAVMLMLFASLVYGEAKTESKKPATKKSDCAYCSEVKKAEEKLRDKKTPKEDLDVFQLAITAIAAKMTADNPKITDAQAAALVHAFDSSIAKDPAKAIVINNLSVITENRDAFFKAIDRLPKARAKAMHEAIDMAIGLETPASGINDDK